MEDFDVGDGANGAEEVLGADARRAAEGTLGRAWGGPVAIRSAQVVAGRAHVVRLAADDGRTAILKRSRATDSGGRWGDEPHGLAAEWAALDLLSAMPEPVAPRLLGGSPDHRFLVMEDLPPGRSLARSLLGGDPAVARADLVAYGEALAALAGWTAGRVGDYRAARGRHGLEPGAGSWWAGVAEAARPAFLAAADALGLATAGVAAEMVAVGRLLDCTDGAQPAGPGGLALVHGDPCPDNVRIVDGRCRIFDFERSSLGSTALDAAYLLAPFPSCWCFGRLPDDAAGPALGAYRARLAAAGADLSDAWERAVAAALAAWLVARGDTAARACATPGDDPEWGTTTLRPRLRAWLGGFLDWPASGSFPRFRALVAELADRLHEGGPPPVPSYPAFAARGDPVARAPTGWADA